jgi:hypothetical protein
VIKKLEAQKTTRPNANSEMAQYLTEKIDAIASTKSVKEIATELGYEKAKMVTMLASGEIKLQLDKVPALARALNADLSHLFRLALNQYWPGIGAELDEIIVRPAEVEARILTEHPGTASSTSGHMPPAPSAKAALDAAPQAPGGAARSGEAAATFVDLNFKVSPGFHRQFRIEAAQRELSMKELFIVSFETYLSQSPASK